MNACGRKGFTIDKINKDAYICSLPFFRRNGPTEEDPDPINVSFLECELVRKKDKKEKEKTYRMRPLVSCKKESQSKKHSKMEISPLNSTVQNDATDFDESLVGYC